MPVTDIVIHEDGGGILGVSLLFDEAARPREGFNPAYIKYFTEACAQAQLRMPACNKFRTGSDWKSFRMYYELGEGITTAGQLRSLLESDWKQTVIAAVNARAASGPFPGSGPSQRGV